MVEIEKCVKLGGIKFREKEKNNRGITIYIPNLKIEKGGKVDIRDFHFSQGISRLFCEYFIPSVARDEIFTKQSRNPEGKVKIPDVNFPSRFNL